MEERLIAKVAESFDTATHIKTKWNEPKSSEYDYDLITKFNDKDYLWCADVKLSIQPHHINDLIEKATRTKNLIVISANINERVRQHLRHEGVNYIDLNGNAYLRQNEIMLWLDGRKKLKEQTSAVTRTFSKSGLKLIFLLLSESSAVTMTHRSLATKSGIALGSVPMIMKGLKDDGYLLKLNKNRYTLENKEELLNKWVEGYGNRLKPSIAIGNYNFSNTQRSWHNTTLQANDVWSSEVAAAILDYSLDPEKISIYSNRTYSECLKDYRLIPDEKGKIEIIKQFWDDTITDTIQKIAPYIVIYADLLLSGDYRNQEIALELYENIIKQNMIQ